MGNHETSCAFQIFQSIAYNMAFGFHGSCFMSWDCGYGCAYGCAYDCAYGCAYGYGIEEKLQRYCPFFEKTPRCGRFHSWVY